MSQTQIKDNRIGVYRGQLIPKLAPHSTRAGIVAPGKTVAPGVPVIVVGEGPRSELIVRPIEDGDVLSAETFGGIVQGDEFRTNEAGEGYGAGKSVAIVELGVITIETSEAVSFRKPVYVGNTTATLGEFKDAPSAGFAQIPGARFYSSELVDGFAKVQLVPLLGEASGGSVPTPSVDGTVLVADNGAWTQLAPGTVGQVLTIGASGPEWATP